jgi:putative ABC transport system substrate-binding protein
MLQVNMDDIRVEGDVRRREFITLLGGAAVALLDPDCALAQEARKVKRMGFLRMGPPPSAWLEGLRHGLRELGYIEGRNLTIEFGLAPNAAQVPDFAAELVRLKVAVILASGTPAVLAAKDAAGTIPVVFVAAIDPVATGLVASLARPGGNVTGLTNTQADITGKQLQLLMELLPELSRIAVMVRPTSHASTRYVEEAETAARALGAQLQILNLGDPIDLEEVLSTAQRATAVIMTDDAVFTAYRTQIADLALKNRLPFISTTSEFVNAGGLMSYGPSTTDLYRRAAAYVGKILNGAKAADLPVEQPTKFELVINLKTAKALGLIVPPILLSRADGLIE